jgi:hypothetical protein
MNGKFESNSNDYDESNLNRLYSVPGAGVRVSIARNEFQMDAGLMKSGRWMASKRSPGERNDTRDTPSGGHPHIAALMRATISNLALRAADDRSKSRCAKNLIC